MQSAHACIVTQLTIRPEKQHEFDRWLLGVKETIKQIPGFISQEVNYPEPPQQPDWIVLHYFVSRNAAQKWLISEQHEQLFTDAQDWLLGIMNVYILQEQQQGNVTVSASITASVQEGAKQQFLDWQARIAPLQARFPGFIGCKIEPSKLDRHVWTTIVTFDSEQHLNAWLNSHERQNMLKELASFSTQTHMERRYEGFDFWFKKQSARVIWKENMLVLLTLYPVVFALSFILRPLNAVGVPFWLTLFISNAISTCILAYITVPFLMKKFSWWISPKKRSSTYIHIVGTLLVIGLYLLSLGIAKFLSAYL